MATKGAPGHDRLAFGPTADLNWSPEQPREVAIPITLSTTNPDWGFFGAIRHHADSEQSWTLAMHAVGKATGCSEPAVRTFLDSRHGRHFADEVANGLADGTTLEIAIAKAISLWQNWRINRRTSREIGIPHGLPFLTGLVVHFEIISEIEETDSPAAV
jgi:hypothetical protein